MGENNNINMKSEKICRTCLVDDGSFFDIAHTFNRVTLAQMIQDITNLQVESSDGFTQFVCFKCVKEVRRAHKFRRKCLESSRSLLKIKTDVSVLNINKPELIESQKIKLETEESCNPADYLKAEYSDEDEFYKPSSSTVENNYNNHDPCTKIKGSIINYKKYGDKKNLKTIFDCPRCHALFINDNVFKKHIQEFHSDTGNDESFNKVRVPLGFLVKEKSENKVKLVYKCAIDDFLGNSFIEFKSHMREHTGDKPVICTDCDFKTTDLSLLKKHKVQKHTSEKRYSCPDCEYSCQTKYAMKNHSSIHTTEKNFACKLCPMTFRHGSALSEHKKRKHEMRRPYVCNICQKAFFMKKVLTKHMAVHTGERPHVCHVCGMAFTQRVNLNTHVSLKHEPPKEIFKCEICIYSTKQKYQLSEHMKRHTGEKNLMCPHCSFRTNKNNTLKLHVMRHLGEMKYSCELCDYKCLRPYELEMHKRDHTGERPFNCNICSYSAKTHWMLARHLQIHDTEQKFVCSNCPYKTNIKALLQRHTRKNCESKKKGRPSLKTVVINEIPNNMDNKLAEDSGQAINLLYM